MLVHLRLTVPTALSEPGRRPAGGPGPLGQPHRAAVGASRSPVGDLVECDVARELVGEVLDPAEGAGARRGGRHRGDHADGDAVHGRPAPRAPSRPGDPDDAVIWDAGHRAGLRREPPDGVLPRLPRAGHAAGGHRGHHRLGGAGDRGDGRRAGVRHRRRDRHRPGVRADADLTVRALRLLVLSFVVAIAVVALLSLLAGLTGLVDLRDGDPSAARRPASSGTPTAGRSSWR